ncbi:S1C family serine protease [Thermocatellispora tengchongensis]|uniref:S1C family serine protease n=1 Tax=Thermocatellispora tengchongensis TaxID=1073253 RepID=UPI00362D9C15
MTSAHLVAGAREITVVRPDGTPLTARVLGSDPSVGVAALRVNDSGLPPLHSGSGLAQARPQDRAYAVGASGALMAGSIRALKQPVTVAGGGQVAAIRIDTDPPAGSAGGPLVDESGYVLGVLTATTGTDGGFAIPVDVARAAALEIVREG